MKIEREEDIEEQITAICFNLELCLGELEDCSTRISAALSNADEAARLHTNDDEAKEDELKFTEFSKQLEKFRSFEKYFTQTVGRAMKNIKNVADYVEDYSDVTD